MILYFLLLLIPASLLLEYLVHAQPIWVFAVALLAIIPLAEYIRRATEQLSRVSGSAVGGLLNITFGNVAELIIALFVLRAGQPDVVKAQITGSILGNSLLGLGLAIVVGSWGREKQLIKRERAGLLGSLLILAVIGLLVPAIFDYTERGLGQSAVAKDARLSLAASVVLILVYMANLIYSMVTHRDVFAIHEPDEEAGTAPPWLWWKSVAVLVVATAAIAWEAELISGALESTAKTLGLSSFFIGITVLAIIGNIAEYISAVYFARQDRMGLVTTITIGSTVQVALFVAPVLVIVSHFMGKPMDLVFRNPLELIAIAACAFIVNAITQDGETTWFEGVLLLAVYAILAIAFFFVGT
ncbi:MAG: calcium/proton exchanger [Gemmatimonadota bacterium]|nr:calcium/proton exchanger [Gemmatimonadota bacterium]